MIDAVLKYFSHWLLAKLTLLLEPEQAARAAKLLEDDHQLDSAETAMSERKAAFEAKLAQSEKDHQKILSQIAALDDAIAEGGKRLARDEQERKGIESELAQTESDIALRPDTNRIDEPLPGTDHN